MNIIAVFAGGMLGALLRYLCSVSYAKWKVKPDFPLVIILINSAGSFLLGAIQHAPLPVGLYSFLGTGCLGAFTTFSTFSLEAVQLYSEQRYFSLVLYVLISLAGCMSAYQIGFLVFA